MAKVRVTINTVTGEVDEGITLLEAAEQIGAGVAHLCFGNAICSTCRVQVIEGESSLEAQQIKERVSLNYHLCFDPKMRLSCQTRIKGPGPVVVAAPKPFSWIAPKDKANAEHS